MAYIISKLCKTCNKAYSIDQFYSGKNQCKSCISEVRRKRIAADRPSYNKARAVENRKYYRKKQANLYMAAIKCVRKLLERKRMEVGDSNAEALFILIPLVSYLTLTTACKNRIISILYDELIKDLMDETNEAMQ